MMLCDHATTPVQRDGSSFAAEPKPAATAGLTAAGWLQPVRRGMRHAMR